ncbi:MAG: ABC transporter ATP-binding protein [Bacteriovoracaceae bacterium]|jgi:putative ABC transport system ATP-binding protein|nr:ABC transporter ATP-binding protein [Bacteriovoracaceae bacterium]
MNLLRVDKISKTFIQGENHINVFNKLSFELEKGKTASVIGQSGSGKSTLLSLLAGLDRPNEGQIVFSGKPFSTMDEDELTGLRNGKIGIIFQQFHLISHLTVLENVYLPLEIQGSGVDKNIAKEFLERVGLSCRLDHLPAQLSGGEKQRVAIARALIIKPDLLLADEPSGSLDNKTGESIIELIFNLAKEEQTGLVLVTHNRNLAILCDDVWRLTNKGLAKETPC